MAIENEKLLTLVTPRQRGRIPQQEPMQSAPKYPMPHEVVYAHPNPDQSTKSCSNCFIWVVRSNQCLIHRPDVEVTADMLCSYHTYGIPSVEWQEMGVDATYPELSGLEIVPGGASCGGCIYFTKTVSGGLCRAVADPATGSPPFSVEALGCCARFVGAAQ